MGFFNLFGDIKDVALEAIEDPDKRNELALKLEQMEQEAYLKAVSVQTIPWVDAIHKLSRPALSALSIIVPAYLLSAHPDINPMALAFLAGPTGIYHFIKGKGK